MTTADLANYTAIVRQPRNITYRNTRIFSTVAPSSGTVVLSALKVFEGFDDGNVSDRYVVAFLDYCSGYTFVTATPPSTSQLTVLSKLRGLPMAKGLNMGILLSLPMSLNWKPTS